MCKVVADHYDLPIDLILKISKFFPKGLPTLPANLELNIRPTRGIMGYLHRRMTQEERHKWSAECSEPLFGGGLVSDMLNSKVYMERTTKWQSYSDSIERADQKDNIVCRTDLVSTEGGGIAYSVFIEGPYDPTGYGLPPIPARIRIGMRDPHRSPKENPDDLHSMEYATKPCLVKMCNSYMVYHKNYTF